MREEGGEGRGGKEREREEKGGGRGGEERSLEEGGIAVEGDGGSRGSEGCMYVVEGW